MHPPDELMSHLMLPALRKLVSRRLRRDGLSQGRISSLLGVTQASVSLYLSGDSGAAYSALQSLALGREEADRYAALLAEDLKRSPADAVGTLVSVWRDLLGRGLICPAHRSEHPELASCDVCMREFGPRPAPRDPQPLQLVSKAVRILESAPGLARAMPEVSINLVYAPAGSSSPEDVVAVPGRIVRVHGSVRATLPPEYGASAHMSRVLLAVAARLPKKRAAVNLRYDPRMAGVLSRLGVATVSFGGSYPPGAGDRVVAAVVALLKSARRFEALADTGGEGSEPNLYLFGAGPVEVARLAARLASAYAAA